jgi:hypothetical protein
MALTALPQEGTTMLDEQEEQTIYKLMLNHEEQYSKGWYRDSTAFPVAVEQFS